MEIAVENLTKYYGSFCAVDGMSFSFQSGKITAIVGRNGSGKTTTIRSLLGLIPMDSGKILVDHREQGLELKHVGYLAEERGMAILCTRHTMFTACGLLYEQGLRGGVG